MRLQEHFHLGTSFNTILSTTSIIFTLLASLITLHSDICLAQVKEEWVARYEGSINADTPVGIALDAIGNVYVAGTTGELTCPWITIKYDAQGRELWVSKFYGPEQSLMWINFASAFAVDSSGNAYITGCSSRWDKRFSLTYTIKLDSNGNQLWMARFNDQVSEYDGITSAVAVDIAGNVYVTGTGSSQDGEHREYKTIKYDGSGNLVWVSRYKDPDSMYDMANALALDTAGNVYVTGLSDDKLGLISSCTTIKYDGNGNLLWASKYTGPNGSGRNDAHDLAVDASGNVYVTGFGNGSGTSYDYVTIKYDSNGNEVWVARYDGVYNSSSTDDKASCIALDGAGNVYVTGTSNDPLETKFVTLKYDSNGNRIWMTEHRGSYMGTVENKPTSITLDAAANVYIAGTGLGTDMYADYFTVKYDNNGNQLWEAIYDYSQSGTGFNAFAVDSAASVYMVMQGSLDTVKLVDGSGSDASAGSGGGSSGGCFINSLMP